MEVTESGIVLYTIAYDECVAFYEQVLELPVVDHGARLTCFQIGDSYLMVEVAGESDETEVRGAGRDRVCLRLDVPDGQVACMHLDTHDVAYDYEEHDWGTVAKFRDPDGNLVALRSVAHHPADRIG